MNETDHLADETSDESSQTPTPAAQTESRPATLDGKSLAIGVLSVTAAVFFTAFLLLTTLTKPAQAIGMGDSGGDYKMLTQQITSSQEGIVVIDMASGRMILYGFDFNRRQLMPLSGFELKDLRKATPAERPVAPANP
jgi:hypothetical protein